MKVTKFITNSHSIQSQIQIEIVAVYRGLYLITFDFTVAVQPQHRVHFTRLEYIRFMDKCLHSETNVQRQSNKWINLIQANLATRLNAQVPLPSIFDCLIETVSQQRQCSLDLSYTSHLILHEWYTCIHFSLKSQIAWQIFPSFFFKLRLQDKLINTWVYVIT